MEEVKKDRKWIRREIKKNKKGLRVGKWTSEQRKEEKENSKKRRSE